MKKKAQLSIYFAFIIIAIAIIFIAAVLAPMGVKFNTMAYAAGENILLSANNSIAAIHNAGVKAELYNSTGQALGSIQNNIEVNNQIFQYSWILILGLTALIIFILTRRVVEVGGFV